MLDEIRNDGVLSDENSDKLTAMLDKYAKNFA
jgi:hypothetical protein